ncbi:MAG: nitroreductase family protein [Candidatus Rokuibacteriota bacterium]
MDFRDVLRRRRMVRRFQPTPVDDGALTRLLRAAQRGPSAGHTQPLELVVVRDPAVRRELSRASWSRGARPDAGDVTIVFCGDLVREAERYGARGAGKYLPMDVGFAVLLFMLAAVDEGLGAGLIGDFHEEHVQAALGLPPHVTPVAMVIVGHPDEPPAARPRRPWQDVVHRDRYAPAYDWSSRRLPPPSPPA